MESSIEETSSETSAEKDTSTQEASSQEPSENQTPATEPSVPENTTPIPTTETAAESTTSVPITESTTFAPSTEALPEAQILLPTTQETVSEEAPAPAQDQASIQQKKVILRAMSPFTKNATKNEQNQIAYTFEVKAVLTIQTTPLSDGSTQYQFTLEFPQEILSDEYTDAQMQPLELMQLTNAQTILKLQDADCSYYGEIVLEQQP